MTNRKIKILLTGVLLSGPALAKLNVVATTTDLAAVLNEVGGAELNVDAIAKGTQDPHYLEAKPSYMVKVSKADLVVANGLELEIGWLPSILRGARNPAVMPGSKGYLEVGTLVPVLEKATGAVTRAEGDVHPEGNPHIHLDPIRMGTIAVGIGKKLAELDPAHAQDYGARAEALQSRLTAKTQQWAQRIQKSQVKKVITYHKTLTYFLDRFALTNAGMLEPKPGIPPTAAHIIDLIKIIKDQKVPLILVENYFETSAAVRIAKDVPAVKIESVAVSVGGSPQVKTLDDLYENLVSAIESVSRAHASDARVNTLSAHVDALGAR